MSILKSFKDKKFRYGASSTLIAVFFIVIIVLANQVVTRFNVRIDLTANRMYTISDQTRQALANINEDVQIFTLYPLGQEINLITEVVNQYPGISNRIRVENRDPLLNPAFLAEFGDDIAPNSIIVTSANRTRIVHPNELFTIQLNPFTFQMEPTHFVVEPTITNAILYVVADTAAHVYELIGHGNPTLQQEFINLLSANGYQHGTLNLLTDFIPDHADLLIFSTPRWDISPNEADLIINFLDNGGSAFFAIDQIPEDFENTRRVLDAFGIMISGGFLHEMAGRHAAGNPRWVHPLISQHDINRSILDNERFMLLMDSQVIAASPLTREHHVFNHLLGSTGQSFVRLNPANVSPSRMDDDLAGPFILGAAIEDFVPNVAHPEGGHTVRIVMLGSSTIFDNEINQAVSGANGEFFINSINWLLNHEMSHIIVPPVPLIRDDFLMVTQQEQNILSVLAMAGLPGIILIFGGIVWLRRRNR